MEPSKISANKPATLADLGINANLLPSDLKTRQVRNRIFGLVTGISMGATAYTTLWFTATRLVVIGASAVSSILTVAFGVTAIYTFFKVRSDINKRHAGLDQLFINFNLSTAKSYFERNLITPTEMQTLFNHYLTGKEASDFPNVIRNCTGDRYSAGIVESQPLRDLFQLWFASELALESNFEQTLLYANELPILTDELQTAYAARAYQKCIALIDDDKYNAGELSRLRAMYASALSNEQKETLNQEEANLVFRKLNNGENFEYPHFVFRYITATSLNIAKKLVLEKLYTITPEMMSLDDTTAICKNCLELTNLSEFDCNTLIEIRTKNLLKQWVQSFKDNKTDYVTLVSNCDIENLVKLANDPFEVELKELLKERFALLPEQDIARFAHHKELLGINDDYISWKSRQKFFDMPMTQVLTEQRNVFFQRVAKHGWADDFREVAVKWLETARIQNSLIFTCVAYDEFFNTGIFTRETLLLNGQSLGELIDTEATNVQAENLLIRCGENLKKTMIFGRDNIQIQLKAAQFIANNSAYLFSQSDSEEHSKTMKLAEELLPEYLRTDLIEARKIYQDAIAREQEKISSELKRTADRIVLLENDRGLLFLKQRKDRISATINTEAELLNQLRSKLDSEQKENARMKSKIETLEKQLITDRNNLAAEIQREPQLKQQLQVTKARLESDLVAVNEELTRIATRKQEIKNSVTPEQRQMEALKLRLADLNKSKEGINAKMSEVALRIQKHEASLQPITGLRNALSMGNSTLKPSELNQLQIDLEQYRQKLADLKSEEVQVVAAIEKIGLAGENIAVSTELAHLEQQSTVLDTKRKSIAEQIARNDQQSNAHTKLIQDLKARIESNRKELSELRVLAAYEDTKINQTAREIAIKEGSMLQLKLEFANVVTDHQKAMQHFENELSIVIKQMTTFKANVEKETHQEKVRLETNFLDGLGQFAVVQVSASAPV